MSEWIEHKGYRFRNEEVKKKFYYYRSISIAFLIAGTLSFIGGGLFALFSSHFTIPPIQDMLYVAPAYIILIVGYRFVTKYDKIAQSDDVRHWKQEP